MGGIQKLAEVILRIVLKKTGEDIAFNVRPAKTELSRIVGLMFNKEMVGFDGLLIDRCNSIHTFFMRYSIDVLFLDNDNRIVKIFRNLVPWRVTFPRFRARKVLELKGGSLSEAVQEGEVLEFVCSN